MTEEDEAFNEIERQAKQRKESVRAAINKDKPMNNPPAFPSGNDVKFGDWKSHGHSGMTLRDYFAAKAMQATINAWDSQGGDRAAHIASIIAEESYELADAMLKERDA